MPLSCYRKSILIFFSLRVHRICTATVSEVFAVKVERFKKCSIYLDADSTGSTGKSLVHHIMVVVTDRWLYLR